VPPLTGLILLFLIFASRDYVWLYRGLWFGVSHLIPVAVLLGCGLLELSLPKENTDSATSQKTFLLLAMAGLCSLIQFPFAAPVYFLYVAPLLWLALTSLNRFEHESDGILGVALGTAALVFIVLRVTPGFIFNMGVQYAPDTQTYELHLNRAAGLRVDLTEGKGYEQLIGLVDEHSEGGRIYAGPDSPQMYFLAGKPNPTGTLFDFLDDPSTRESRIRQTLEGPSTLVAVVLETPYFSPPLSPALQEVVWLRYSHAQRFGPFTVHW